jgi:O-antigen/teichoic acid export membrane protein
LKRSLPVVAGWSARIVSAACSLVNTRLLIELMGVDGYAAMTIVLSLMPWFALLTLGLPNAAQNQIAQRRAKALDIHSLKQATVDATCVAVVALLPLALVLALGIQHLLLAGHPGLSFAWVAVLSCALLFNGFSAIFHQVLYATHRAVWPSVAPAVQALLTMAGLGLAIAIGSRHPFWGAAAVALPMLVVFWLSAHRVGARPRLAIDWSQLRALVVEGRGFLLFGAAAQLTLACDYIVMAFLLSSDSIVQYNLAAKAFGIILTLHTVLLAASWTPMSDRYFSGQFGPLRQYVRRLLGAGFGLALLIALPLVLFMDDVVALLSGGQAAPLPLALVAGWVVYLCIRVWSDTFATALLSFNELATMNYYVFWQAAISVPAQWALGARFGAAGIVLGIIVSFLATAAWVLPLRFSRLTRPALSHSTP